MFDVHALTQLAKWEPQYDRIMVLPFIRGNASLAGLIAPGENREKPETGIVIAVGPGGPAPETGRDVVVNAQVGELVLYGKYAGIAIDSADAQGAPLDLYVMRDCEVLAKRRVRDYRQDELVIHNDDPRKIHFAGLTCEFCDVATSAERLASYREAAEVADKVFNMDAEMPAYEVEQERERLRLARQTVSER